MADNRTDPIFSVSDISHAMFKAPVSFTEQPTMALRWHQGVLEQAHIRTGDGIAETVWRAVPTV